MVEVATDVTDGPETRPGQVCRELLAALDASEGRRRRRKRDTTPDAIGLTIKRDLLERAIAADPAPDQFEAWLHEQCLAAGGAEGGVRRLAQEADSFRDWLSRGAPSDDALREPAPDGDRTSTRPSNTSR